MGLSVGSPPAKYELSGDLVMALTPDDASRNVIEKFEGGYS